MKNVHHYTHQLKWLGESGLDSIRNDRQYEIVIEGKDKIVGSADKPFFGDPTKLNPEDMLLASLSACHMMSFLYLCRKNNIKVLSYEDNPEGVLKVNIDGSGQFEKVILKPKVKIIHVDQSQEVIDLQPKAGKLCFIANSCKFKIEYAAQIIC